MKRRKALAVSVVLLQMVILSTASAVDLYTAEHGDIGVAYEAGMWDLHVHLHAGAVVNGEELLADGEWEADDLIIQGNNASHALRPAGSAWDPVGAAAGESIWALPQHDVEGLPVLGLATEEIEGGVFLNDQVTLSILGVNGPGEFSIWQTDGLGVPTFFMSTSDSLLSMNLATGAHGHYAWGFTSPGLYDVTFQASGELVGGGVTSSSATYTFEIIPEPATLMFVLLGTALTRIRRIRPEPSGPMSPGVAMRR